MIMLYQKKKKRQKHESSIIEQTKQARIQVKEFVKNIADKMLDLLAEG